MRRKTLLIIAVCIVALVATSLFLWNPLHPQIPLKYERNIHRAIDNQEEANALIAAETANYSAIFSIERFHGSSEPAAYFNPDNYPAETSAQFIDSEVINYYETRYASLQGRGDPKQIQFKYDANVRVFSQFRVFIKYPPENQTWNNGTTLFLAPDGSVLFQNAYTTRPNWGMKLAYKNQSDYQMLQPGFDLNFSDCYIVDMKLMYSELHGVLAAYWSDVYQIVVLDRNFEPVLLGVQSQKVVA